jgi:hypothetical protein
MGTGYTVCNFTNETVVKEELQSPNLFNLRIEKDELVKKIQREEHEISCYETDIEIMKENLQEGKEGLKKLKSSLFEIESKISDFEVSEASDMIDKLKALGFDVYKKDSVETVYIHFPEEEKIFGIKGSMLYQDEAIAGKFNEKNFDQLFDKKLKIININEEEMGAHTKMNHFIKRSFERIGDGFDEKKVVIVFTSSSGVEVLSKVVFIQLERLNKQYKTEDLNPYWDLTFRIRKIMPHEL